MTGLFAFFHGHVHGTESEAANLIPFAAGLALGLHATEIGLGLFVESSIGKVTSRAIGGLIALGGITLIGGLR
jgi:urease accessory protein